jgi:hypothetical protein
MREDLEDEIMEVSGRNPDQIDILQTVLEILSIYWKPLRKLVRAYLDHHR